MERRLFRTMCVTVVLSVMISTVLAPWRVTTGLLLGGVLSLLNHHWLRTAIGAAFGTTIAGVKPKIKIVRYLFRYFIVAVMITIANLLDIVSLTATLIGLCSFVIAALMEAFMQTYFAIVHREEN